MNMSVARKLYGTECNITLVGVGELNDWYSYDYESSDHVVLNREDRTVRMNRTDGSTVIYVNNRSHVLRIQIAHDGIYYMRIFS